MHRPSIARLAQHGGLVAELPPPYLAPSLHFSMTRLPQSSSFSTTPVAAGRGRDMNRTRGVSAIHRTGTRFKLSASRYPLPKPVSPADMQPQPPNPNHGLWGFFPKSREAMSVPEFDMDFGECKISPATVHDMYQTRIALTDQTRSPMGHPRTTGEELGRPAQAVVGVCQGAQPHCDYQLGERANEGWFRWPRDQRA
jgi:hypothetical protein